MPISRAELPEEFFDMTSPRLLRQPEPKYLYAGLFKAALAIELGVPDAVGLGDRAIQGQGAPYTPADADRLALAQDLGFNELFAITVNHTGTPGHTLRFNRPAFTDSTYTQAARQIGSNQTISVVPITAGSEQANLTIKRFGGPYDNTNTRVAPFALDNFDASMGVHNLARFIGTHLQRDFDKTLESFWVTLIDTVSADTTHIVYPDGMTADNDATSAGQFPATYEQLSRTSRKMDEANLPTLGDGRRVLVMTPMGKKQLKDDPQFARYAKDFPETNPLISMGWFATIPEFHCFVSNTLTTTNNSSSVAIHKGHALAPGALFGGSGKPPRVAASTDDNYGETAKVLWLAYLSLGLADQRFGFQVRYAADAG